MMINAFLINVFHSIPHYDFTFRAVKTAFSLEWRSEYAQALAVVGGAVAAVALLLLLTIAITWICQCCRKADNTVKPRRKVRRLSLALFVISIFCFFFLGFCLFGNDQVNRGVARSIASLQDVSHQLGIATSTGDTLNELSRNASVHVKALEELVHQKSKDVKNQTVVNEIDTRLTQLSDSIDTVIDRLAKLKEMMSVLPYLSTARVVAEHAEFERWLLFVVLFSIIICVLFAGVIAFCRQSKMGAVMFSGTGLVVFIVIWAIFTATLPATVALSDFCGHGGDFLTEKLTPPLLKTLAFYSECDARPSHDNVPNHLGVNNISDELGSMQKIKAQLDSLMDGAFNKSEDIAKASALLVDDGTRSLKAVGALESGLACYAYRDDLRTMQYGLCTQAIIGSAVLNLCLVLLIVFMFALLIIVSKSWNLFTRFSIPSVASRGWRPVSDIVPSTKITSSSLSKKVSFRGSDYIEVDEDDPFFPRANDSNIPVDIYGTHVYNPRTRDRTEPSTGTTTATVNGQGESDPLWRQPATAPMATLTRNDYSNYQDRYDV